MLQAGSAGGVGQTALYIACNDAIKHLTDTRQARGHHQVTRQHAAAGVDHSVITQAQGAAEDDLLVTERRVQFGHVNSAV